MAADVNQREEMSDIFGNKFYVPKYKPEPRGPIKLHHLVRRLQLSTEILEEKAKSKDTDSENTLRVARKQVERAKFDIANYLLQDGIYEKVKNLDI